MQPRTVMIPTPGGETSVRLLPLRTPTLPPATHTNCVVVGQGRYLLVDPASPWPEEQKRLIEMVDALAAGGEKLEGILLTHHHLDHVSGANALRAHAGVPVFAHPRTADKLAGHVRIDVELGEGDTLPIDERWELVHTPGHAPGHLCARSAESGVIVAGDMVAAIGTIVIEPDDDGDMTQYLDSLRRLRTLDPTCLVPAHGDPIVDAAARLDFYVAHRLEREEKVAAALDVTPRPLLDLVPLAYPEVAPMLHLLASRSLLAHLYKLERDGRAARVGHDWKRAS